MNTLAPNSWPLILVLGESSSGIFFMATGSTSSENIVASGEGGVCSLAGGGWFWGCDSGWVRAGVWASDALLLCACSPSVIESASSSRGGGCFDCCSFCCCSSRNKAASNRCCRSRVRSLAYSWASEAQVMEVTPFQLHLKHHLTSILHYHTHTHTHLGSLSELTA